MIWVEFLYHQPVTYLSNQGKRIDDLEKSLGELMKNYDGDEEIVINIDSNTRLLL